MTDAATTLIDRAESHLVEGDAAAARSSLEKAYIPVQGDRDLAAVRRALALVREVETAAATGSRERRKARRIGGWYAELEPSYAMTAPLRLGASAGGSTGGTGGDGPSATGAAGHGPSLEWIDGLIGILGIFTILELIGGGLIAAEADATTSKVAGIAGAVFAATMLLALIAILRLLQRIEQNTRPTQ
ncbi:MAG TPA: hypothetical protein VGL44_09150 [Gaiellales bacterium]